MIAKEQMEFTLPRRMRGLQPTLIRQFFERALPDSINFGLGEPDLPTPQFMRAEAARVVSRKARVRYQNFVALVDDAQKSRRHRLL